MRTVENWFEVQMKVGSNGTWERFQTFRTAIGAQGACVEYIAEYVEKNKNLREDSQREFKAVSVKKTIETVELP